MSYPHQNIPLLALVLALFPGTDALAFPPAPHHTLYGVVKNEQGTPLETGSATIVLSGPNGVVMRGPVDAGLAPGINYVLRVPLDGNRTSQLYMPTAMLPTSPFTIRVVIGSTGYVPIQMQGELRELGAIGGSTRLDLTLGVDSDSDGLPDSWERDVIDFDPDDTIRNLADVSPGGDADRDGMSNLSEYIAGTYAFDRLDGLNLKVKEVAEAVATLEFVTIPGRTYHLTASVDGVTWTEQPFSLKKTGEGAADYHRAESVTVLHVHVPVGAHPETLFKLHVE